MKMDRIPERLRTAAEGVARATQMIADAKSERNRAAGEPGASYSGLTKEQTAEWKGARLIEEMLEALELLQGFNFAIDDSPHGKEIRRRAETAISHAKAAA